MGRPYSLDLRERVVAAVHEGMSCEEAADFYQVSKSSAIRWVRRERETGSAAALPMGGKRPFALADQRDWLLGRRRERKGGPASSRRGSSHLMECSRCHPYPRPENSILRVADDIAAHPARGAIGSAPLLASL
jgi:transposase